MEEIKVSGAKLKATLKALIREGNVRRIVRAPIVRDDQLPPGARKLARLERRERPPKRGRAVPGRHDDRESRRAHVERRLRIAARRRTYNRKRTDPHALKSFDPRK